LRTDETGSGSTPAPSQAEGRRPGFRERAELASQRVPFRIKLALVWVAIFTVLGILFAAARFDTTWLADNFSFIALGLPWTILIAALAIILAVILALIGALGRLSKNPIAFGVAGFYTSFFRGTPLIVQLFLIYLALPEIAPEGWGWLGDRLTLSVLQAGVIGLGLNYGAYMTEIFRAGIQSVGHGQREAAEALGLTYPQVMRRVVLPQALRVIIPPTGNEFIAMLKDSALVSLLGSVAGQLEVFRRAQLVGRADFRPLEAYLAAASVYWALTTIFQYFQSRLERRLSKGYVRAAVQRKTKWVPESASGSAGSGAIQVEVAVEDDEATPGPMEHGH
jgi:polar amino acid transport system permease protein